MADKKETFDRLVILNLRHQHFPGEDACLPMGDTSIVPIHTSLSNEELLIAIEAAAKDYLNTEEGRAIFENNCRMFDYGDFLDYVDDSFCEAHGFRIAENVSLIDDDYNTQFKPDTKQ